MSVRFITFRGQLVRLLVMKSAYTPHLSTNPTCRIVSLTSLGRSDGLWTGTYTIDSDDFLVLAGINCLLWRNVADGNVSFKSLICLWSAVESLVGKCNGTYRGGRLKVQTCLVDFVGLGSVMKQIILGLNSFRTTWLTSSMISYPRSVEPAWTAPFTFCKYQYFFYCKCQRGGEYSQRCVHCLNFLEEPLLVVEVQLL